MIEHRIPDQVPTLTLERYMRRAWPLLPGHVIRDALKRRDIRINGVRCAREQTVAGGDCLTVYLDERWFSQPAGILWTDEKLIVAVKPQGLPVDVDQDGVGADTLLARLKVRWPSVRLCHRLDAATGGIVMAAADEGVREQAFEAFRTHGVRKTYRALALRRFEHREGTLHAWLEKDAKQSRVRVLHRDRPGAKPIETRYRVLDERAPGIFEVALEPVTGRTHQLRAHMADFGHPLLGDDQYGERAVNRSYPHVKLCLWHARLHIPEDSALKAYAGRVFETDAPDWLKNT